MISVRTLSARAVRRASAASGGLGARRGLSLGCVRASAASPVYQPRSAWRARGVQDPECTGKRTRRRRVRPAAAAPDPVAAKGLRGSARARSRRPSSAGSAASPPLALRPSARRPWCVLRALRCLAGRFGAPQRGASTAADPRHRLRLLLRPRLWRPRPRRRRSRTRASRFARWRRSLPTRRSRSPPSRRYGPGCGGGALAVGPRTPRARSSLPHVSLPRAALVARPALRRR